MEELELMGLKEKVSALLEDKNYRALKQLLADYYAVDIAELFEELDSEQGILIFRLLKKEQAAEVFSYMNTAQRKSIVEGIQPNLLNYVFNELYFDDKIDFLEEMPSNFVKEILASAPAQERGLINQFLSYPDNSAGSLMTIEFVDLKKHMTVKESLQRIKKLAMDSETVYTCYVLDDFRKLEGIVTLRHLVMAEADVLIADIMNTQVISVQVKDDQEEVAEQFKHYDLMAVPVVDSEERLVGIITIDDIVDVIEQENTEDFQRMAAVSPSEDAYLETGVFKLARRRIVWLLVLMISASFTERIVIHFQGVLSAVVVLSAFVTMITDSGGNAGSQSSTLIIRGMAVGEISAKDWYKVLFKEARIGMIAGALLALVNALRMVFLGAETYSVQIIFTVSITLFFTVILAKIIGGMLPMIAKALKLDPAIMAGPLITTIVDALALFVYFSIATALLI